MAILDVLKFETNTDVFAWKHPSTDITTGTQLIVNESQEAVLFCNGRTADIFGPGRYTLSTDNIPILRTLVNVPFGGRSPFPAEVWFINCVNSLDIKWGTSSPIQIQDPKYGVYVPVRAFGNYGIRISDSRRFLNKLVGTMRFFNRDTLTDYFRGNYVTRVKDMISSSVVNCGVSLLEINSHLNDLSYQMQEQLATDLAAFGIEVVSFFINDITVSESDPSVIQLKAALAKRAEMEIIGYNYQQERTFDVMESVAANNGAAGSILGMGLGLGMSPAVRTQLKNVIDGKPETIDPQCNAEGKEEESRICCCSCGKKLSRDMKFCPECGAAVVKKCPECGADAEGKFCTQCGGKIF